MSDKWNKYLKILSKKREITVISIQLKLLIVGFSNWDNGQIIKHKVELEVVNEQDQGLSGLMGAKNNPKCIAWRAALNLLIVGIIFIPVIYYNFNGTPFIRGFFCNDESLRHPFLK
jgi:hypothetical protein